MSTTQEIQKMQASGLSDKDIASELTKRGLSKEEISQALSQSQIKQAVSPQEVVGTPSQGQGTTKEYDDKDMEPSIMQPEQQYAPPQQTQPPQTVQQEYQPADYQQYPSQEYQQYPSQEYYQYPSALSPGTITEIAEQAITEKISPLKDQLEKVLDSKTILSAKLTHLSARLERIEKIIDRLQISILQKVGGYINNVQDLKKELTETQKSFKSIVEKPQKVKK
jgi:hypothetical protein